MSIFTKIFSWIKNLFNNIPKDLKQKAVIAKVVVDTIKMAVDHPAVMIVTQLTKTPLDNEIREKVSRILETISKWLGVATVQDIASALRERSAFDRNGTYLKIGSAILAGLDNNSLKENQYDLAMQATVSADKLA